MKAALMGIFVLILMLAVMDTAQANTITGRVVGIADGDTLTVLDSSNTQTKVRLAHIDAPENAQAFGSRSKEALSTLCFGKPASVDVVDRDKYGRTVGVVRCAGQQANRKMVELGLAWAYGRNPKKPSQFTSVESEARRARAGLWVDASPVPPWQFRRARK